MAGLTEFQKRKYNYLFHQFYDTNKNGVITHSDFVDLIKSLQRFRKWTGNDDRLKACQESLNKAWQALKKEADSNRDNKVTLDEWYEYWEGFVAKSKHSSDGWPSGIDWVKDYMNFWFDLLDTSGDGFVDENEFVQVIRYFNPADDGKKAYRNLNGGKPIDRRLFARLWLEYMTSEDASGPGNSLFGKHAWTS